jgi:hypothetical protein
MPEVGGKIRSWIPVIIRGEGGDHVHGLIWWEWDRPWKESRLPKGVELCGFGPMDKGCQLCQSWGAVTDEAKQQRPLGPTVEAIGDHRAELLATRGVPEKPEKPPSAPDPEPEPRQKTSDDASPSLFDDF